MSHTFASLPLLPLLPLLLHFYIGIIHCMVYNFTFCGFTFGEDIIIKELVLCGNILFSYKNKTGTSTNLAYNISGPRISYISIGGTPNIYELPRNSLNFNIRHDFKNGLDLKLAANNILYAKYQQAITFKEQKYYVQSNGLGMDFSIGINFKVR